MTIIEEYYNKTVEQLKDIDVEKYPKIYKYLKEIHQAEENRAKLHSLIDSVADAETLKFLVTFIEEQDTKSGQKSRIYTNESGRYETDAGYYFTSGSAIEFLRTEQVYNEDTDQCKDVEIWTASRVEHNQTDYYIVGYSDLTLSGLKVRIRG